MAEAAADSGEAASQKGYPGKKRSHCPSRARIGERTGEKLAGAPKKGEVRLTRAQKQILGRISVATTLWGGLKQTKREMAEEDGLSEVTVDRAVRRLREFGLIEVEERWHECGSQDANFYRTPE